MRNNLKTPFPLLELPSELLVEIFNRIPLAELLRLRLVSKMLNNMLRGELFKRFEYKLHAAIILNLSEQFTTHLVGNLDLEIKITQLTPLNLAIYLDRYAFLDDLITAGADVNLRGNLFEDPLIFAVSHGHTKCVQILLKHNPDGYFIVDVEKFSILHIAALNGHTECVQVLLNNYAKIDKETFQKFAANAEMTETDLVQSLQKYGLEVNVEGSSEIYNFVPMFFNSLEHWENALSRSPLHLAAEFGHTECVQLLLSAGADVNSKDSDGNTSLHVAAGYKGNIGCFSALLAVENVEVDIQNIYGQSPLHVLADCTIEENIDRVRALLNAGVDPNIRDNENYTALAIAAERGNVECVEALLTVGVSAYDIPDPDGYKRGFMICSAGGYDIPDPDGYKRRFMICSAGGDDAIKLVSLFRKLDDFFAHDNNNVKNPGFFPVLLDRADRFIEITTSEEATGEYREIFIKAVNILLNREGKLALNDEQKTFLLTSVSKLAFSTDEIPALAELAELEAAPPSGGVFSFKG